MTLSDQKIEAILKKTQDAPLEDSVAALIQAVEEAEHPQQDNTTVLLYAPAEGTELAAANVGEREPIQDRPRLKRKHWSRLLGMLLCVAVLWGVLYWLRRGEDVAVEPLPTVEPPAATGAEPTEEADVQVPMGSDAEKSAPTSPEESLGDSTRAGGEKVELNEP